ncbi:TPA: hypothetical protein RNT23_002107 [Stenotrophomonas maltophilia]|nr:hypothetical protein [Stenotrophomonas maltophilia]
MTVTVHNEVLLEELVYLARHMRPDERAQDCAFTGEAEYCAEAAAKRMICAEGPKYVIVDDGLPVVAGGFVFVRPGVWQGWQAGTVDGWEKNWRLITKVTRKLNDRMIADPAVHRLQLCAMAGREKTFEWYERSLRYQREATLHRYCATGIDAVMFSRVKEAE